MFDGNSKPGNSFSRNSHKDSPKVNFHAKVSDSTMRNSSSNDSGSQQSFISKDLANRLQYLTRTQKLSISGLGNNGLVQSSEILDIVLHSKINPYQQFDASCSVIDRITERLPQIALNPHGLKIPDHLIHELADPHFWEPSNIDILIGADLYFSIVKGDLISLGHNQPTILETAFGYVVAGPVPNLSHQKGNYRVPTTHSFLSVQDENNLTVGSDGEKKIYVQFWKNSGN
ncbi:uncharacterized protein [Diabrotica undecimpunctata]|uniref:uncharacterized protein n=1 Tax=Diabrotica undecimpunctata TaxID=50387 RepID=UPI003B639CAB